MAFGDDAAVSGGLVGGTDGEPVFCGDAIADPLTGLHAALGVAESLEPRRRRADRTVDGRRRRNLRPRMTAQPKRCTATPSPSPSGLRARCGQRRGRAPAGRKAVGVMLIQRAVLLDGTATDIRVDERIVDVGDLAPHKGEQVLDAAGATVIPGLHDHHVHLRSAAAALTSARVGPAEVRGRDDLARALADAAVGSDGWIRAVGYHEAVAGPLDRDVLDEVSPPLPVRVQHRSGVLWTLNSAGLARVGLTDHPDGRLRSADRSWSDTLQRNESGLAEVSRRLSEFGVTGVTDATPDFEVSDIVKLMEAHRRGELRQRVHCLAPGKRILHDGDLDLDGTHRVDRRTPRRRRPGRGALRDGRPARRDALGAARGGHPPAGPHRTRGRGARRQHGRPDRPRGHRRDPAQLRRRARRPVPDRRPRRRTPRVVAGGLTAEGRGEGRAVHRHAVRRGRSVGDHARRRPQNHRRRRGPRCRRMCLGA